jgi:hypothetical protein
VTTYDQTLFRGARATMAFLVLALGCSAPVAYRPDAESLHGLERRQREQVFVETISRAIKPRIVQVWIDDVAYGHDDGRVVRDGFGIPVGRYAARRIIYFANVGRLQMFTNNAVFVYDTSGRVVDKLRFGNPDDAARAMDVIAAYRERRMGPGAQHHDDYDPEARYENRRYEFGD